MANPSFDFYSTFFRAAIISDPKNRAGSRWPLWVLNGAQDVQKLTQTQDADGLGSLAFCTDITVSLNLSYIPTITATLSPPIEDARKLLDSNLIEYAKVDGGASLLEVQFGYTNGPDGGALSPVFEGAIINPPEVSFGTEASITLRGTGTGGFGALRAEVPFIYAQKKRINIIKEALQPLGISVDDSGIKAKSDEATALQEEVPSDFAANNVAWFFVADLAIRCGCWITLTVGPDGKPVLKLTAVNDVLGAPPKFKFRYFDYVKGQLDAKTGEFPLLNITTPTTAVFLSGASTGLRTASYDSKTREIKQGKVSDTSTHPQRTGDGVVQSPEWGVKLGVGDFFSENVADPNEQKRAEREFQQAQSTQGTKIDVDTIGIPTLIPGAFIAVSGVSKRLNQNYIVDFVEHTVGSGGYTTKFTAYANVSPLSAGALGSAKKVSTPNTQTKNEKDPQATSSDFVTIQPKAQ